MAEHNEPLAPPAVADILRTIDLRAGYIIGACKDTREMRLEAEEIKRLLDKAFKGMHAWWHGESSQSEMVDRFLSWPLPKTVCSDGCVTDPSYPHERSGTNLLTADEARQMLEHVVGPALAAKQAEIDRSNANG